MKKNRYAGMKIKGCKKRGEWAELVFAMRAVEQGMVVAKPWGESTGYDFVVEPECGRVVRVQVKSTLYREGKGYACSLHNCNGVYKKDSFDFVAAYVIPKNVWYIVPEKQVLGQWCMRLYPELEKSKYGEYQEAWHLLRGPLPGLIARIEAVADDDYPAA